MVLYYVLQQMKQTHQFTEVYVHCGPHKLSVQCVPHNFVYLNCSNYTTLQSTSFNTVLDQFDLYNMVNCLN